MQPAQFQVLIHQVKTIPDRGISITVHTREMNPEDVAQIFMLRSLEAWCCLATREIKPEEINPIDDLVSMGEKSPSQLLRSKMFLYYTNTLGGSKDKFKEWYSSELETIGNEYLNRENE